MWIETLLAQKMTALNVVTPHVGVWIETIDLTDLSEHGIVTPHVGVWIETVVFISVYPIFVSHLM